MNQMLRWAKPLTSSLSPTYFLVAWILHASTGVTDFRVDEPFVPKLFSKCVLHSPEAAGGNGGLLRASRNDLRGGLRVVMHRTRVEHARKPRDDGRHIHEKDRVEGDHNGTEKLQE